MTVHPHTQSFEGCNITFISAYLVQSQPLAPVQPCLFCQPGKAISNSVSLRKRCTAKSRMKRYDWVTPNVVLETLQGTRQQGCRGGQLVVMQQQNMRSLAQNAGTHSLLRSLVPILRRHLVRHTSHTAAAADPAAAATAAAPRQSEQQQHTPHVSVLLQEVLHNLNHMPIKVGVRHP